MSVASYSYTRNAHTIFSLFIKINVNRYRRRYWRASTFDAVELLQRTLQEVYGKDEVSLVQASLRWMIHHSCLKPGGIELNQYFQFSYFPFSFLSLSPPHPDGIILGCSKIEHLTNLDFCKEGPLDQSIAIIIGVRFQLLNHVFFRSG